MDLHVYALLKRKYNDLAESVEGLVDESAELTEEARKTLAEAQDKLDEIKPLLETSKDNVKQSEEQVEKVQEMLDELEPAVADIEAIIKQALQNVHTGEYESDREYLKGNETLYNGSTYRALEDVTGVLPTDTSKWQLVAQRGVDGTGAVSSVNNIAPDENGNVDLGKITADWDDLEGKPEVLEGLGDEDGKLTYKGEEVGEKLVIGRKAYVADGNTTTFKTEFEVEPNTNRVMVYVSGVIQSSGDNFTENKDSITLKFTPAKGTQVLVYTFSGSETLFVDGGIDEEDIKHLETKVDAIKKLEEAKKYTDEEIAKLPEADSGLTITTLSGVSADAGIERYPEGESLSKMEFKGAPPEVTISWNRELGFLPEYIHTFRGDEYAYQVIIYHDTRTMGVPVHHTNRAWDFRNSKWEVFVKDVVLSQSNSANLNNTNTIGDGNNVGDGSHVLGMNNRVNSTVYALGENNTGTSLFTVVGHNNENVGSRNHNYILGERNKTMNSEGSVVIGVNNSLQSQMPSRYKFLFGTELMVPQTQREPSLVLGKYNDNKVNDSVFTIGAGASSSNRANFLTLNETSGDLTVQGKYETGGADYAEMFEWADGNPDEEDRVGLAVTWAEGEYIKLANEGDDVIGIVSSTPAILGDNPMEWDKRFVTDQFGRPLRKVIEVETEDGEVVEKEWFVENPEYDKEAPYTVRTERVEWDAVGLMGKLYWIDDGTLNVGDYATVGEDGKAVKGNKDNGYRVLKRISKNVDGKSGIVKVFFK